MNINSIFQPTLFPKEKGDFDPTRFEEECLTATFRGCILRATAKAINDANSAPKVSAIVKSGYIHDRFYTNAEVEFNMNYTNEAPICYYSETGNERNYIAHNGYIFVFNKQGATKNPTSVLDVINQQQSVSHIITVEYVMDELQSSLRTVTFSYKRGKDCDYYLSIPYTDETAFGANENSNSLVCEQMVEPILPKLKTKNTEKESS